MFEQLGASYRFFGDTTGGTSETRYMQSVEVSGRIYRNVSPQMDSKYYSANNRKCFICNVFGHKARNCYFKTEHDERKGAPEDGYYKNNDHDSIKNRVTRCYLCRKLGHLARECPNPYESENTNLLAIKRGSDEIRNEESVRKKSKISHEGKSKISYEGYDKNTIDLALESLDDCEWDFLKSTEEQSTKSMTNREVKLSKSESLSSSRQHTTEAQYIPDEFEAKYFKKIHIGKKKIPGFLDTCSPKCMIKFSAAQKARLNVQLDDSNIKIHSPTFKGDVFTIGKTTTTLRIDNVVIEDIDLHVVNDDVLFIDIVIGRSWLDQPNIMLIKMANTIYLGDIKQKPFNNICEVLSEMKIKKKEIFDPITSSDEEEKKKIRRGRSKAKHERKSHHKQLRKYEEGEIVEQELNKSTEVIETTRERQDQSRDRNRGHSRPRSRESLRAMPKEIPSPPRLSEHFRHQSREKFRGASPLPFRDSIERFRGSSQERLRPLSKERFHVQSRERPRALSKERIRNRSRELLRPRSITKEGPPNHTRERPRAWSRERPRGPPTHRSRPVSRERERMRGRSKDRYMSRRD